jgi:hypothetical protein
MQAIPACGREKQRQRNSGVGDSNVAYPFFLRGTIVFHGLFYVEQFCDRYAIRILFSVENSSIVKARDRDGAKRERSGRIWYRSRAEAARAWLCTAARPVCANDGSMSGRSGYGIPMRRSLPRSQWSRLQRLRSDPRSKRTRSRSDCGAATVWL